MLQNFSPQPDTEIIYPESDGQPMADNTKQFRLIVTIKENLELLFAQSQDVFIAGDLLWYPVEGDNKIRIAPDVIVVFGRPKGDRGSYLQWRENHIAPQVVFEILSPGNRPQEMLRKFMFYQRYGVEEYYVYDPDDRELTGFIRKGSSLEEIEPMSGWVSPLLGIRFELTQGDLDIYDPNGRKFQTFLELEQQREQERLAKEQALAEKEQLLAELAQEKQLYQELLDRLRNRGIDPHHL